MDLVLAAIVGIVVVLAWSVAMTWIRATTRASQQENDIRLLEARKKYVDAKKMARVRAAKDRPDDEEEDEDDEDEDDEEEPDRLTAILETPLVKGFLRAKGIPVGLIEKFADGDLDPEQIQAALAKFGVGQQQQQLGGFDLRPV